MSLRDNVSSAGTGSSCAHRSDNDVPNDLFYLLERGRKGPAQPFRCEINSFFPWKSLCPKGTHVFYMKIFLWDGLKWIIPEKRQPMAKHSKPCRHVLTYKRMISPPTQKAFTCSLKASFCLTVLLHKDLKPVAKHVRSPAPGRNPAAACAGMAMGRRSCLSRGTSHLEVVQHH